MTIEKLPYWKNGTGASLRGSVDRVRVGDDRSDVRDHAARPGQVGHEGEGPERL